MLLADLRVCISPLLPCSASGRYQFGSFERNAVAWEESCMNGLLTDWAHGRGPAPSNGPKANGRLHCVSQAYLDELVELHKRLMTLREGHILQQVCPIISALIIFFFLVYISACFHSSHAFYQMRKKSAPKYSMTDHKIMLTWSF